MCGYLSDGSTSCHIFFLFIGKDVLVNGGDVKSISDPDSEYNMGCILY